MSAFSLLVASLSTARKTPEQKPPAQPPEVSAQPTKCGDLACQISPPVGGVIPDPQFGMPEFSSATRMPRQNGDAPRPQFLAERPAGSTNIQLDGKDGETPSLQTSVDETSDSAPDAEMSQVTSVTQLTDVNPNEWSYQALQDLVERYGAIAGYPDGKFRGRKPLTRYEFAATLNKTLNRILEILASQQQQGVPKNDLVILQRLEKEFSAELADLKGRVDSLETRTAQLDGHQFSTTTRLFGQAIFSVQGTNKVNADVFPRDGVRESSGKAELNLASNVQLTLATSFTGRDLLLTGLQAGNQPSSAPFVFTNMGRLASELDTNNKLVVSDLSYRFPLSPRFGIIIGAAGVNPPNTFRGINPLEGAQDGSISLFGQRNPILAIGNGTGGIGFDWQINRRVSLQAVYSAELPGFAGDSKVGGLFGGRNATGAQLSIAPTNNLDFGLHYLYSHSPDGLLGTGIGDGQLISPFAPATAFNTHAVGATIAWRPTSRFILGGWGGWTSSTPVNLSGSVQTTNWMVFSAFPDLLRKGNLGGILIGQPPKITSSSLPDGFNLPNFSEGGTKGGRSSSALHLELFYRLRITENISLTPGILIVLNPDHNAANDTLVIGTLRTTFRF